MVTTASIAPGSRSSACFASLVGFIALVLAGTTAAQLEEIVVTAQKREQGINDVGITVNAFSADDLENYGVDTAEDLEKMVPGLTVTNSQPGGAPVYTIRGVGYNDFTTVASWISFSRNGATESRFTSFQNTHPKPTQLNVSGGTSTRRSLATIVAEQSKNSLSSSTNGSDTQRTSRSKRPFTRRLSQPEPLSLICGPI